MVMVKRLVVDRGLGRSRELCIIVAYEIFRTVWYYNSVLVIIHLPKAIEYTAER